MILAKTSLIIILFILSTFSQIHAQNKSSVTLKTGFIRSTLFSSRSSIDDLVPLWAPATSVSWDFGVAKYLKVHAKFTHLSVGGIYKPEITTKEEPEGTGEHILFRSAYDYISPAIMFSFVYPIHSIELISSIGPRFDFLVNGTQLRSNDLFKLHNQGWDMSFGINKQLKSTTYFYSEVVYHTFDRKTDEFNYQYDNDDFYLKINPSISVMAGLGIRF